MSDQIKRFIENAEDVLESYVCLIKSDYCDDPEEYDTVIALRASLKEMNESMYKGIPVDRIAGLLVSCIRDKNNREFLKPFLEVSLRMCNENKETN